MSNLPLALSESQDNVSRVFWEEMLFTLNVPGYDQEWKCGLERFVGTNKILHRFKPKRGHMSRGRGRGAGRFIYIYTYIYIYIYLYVCVCVCWLRPPGLVGTAFTSSFHVRAMVGVPTHGEVATREGGDFQAASVRPINFHINVTAKPLRESGLTDNQPTQQRSAMQSS